MIPFREVPQAQGGSVMVGRFLGVVLILGVSGAQATRAGTIQNIIDGGGSITVGFLTFSNFSVGGNNTMGPMGGAYTAADINVTTVDNNGLKFEPVPFMDLKTNTAATQTLTVSFKVEAKGGIAASGLSFDPGLVELQGTSKVTKSFPDEGLSMEVFQTNTAGTQA